MNKLSRSVVAALLFTGALALGSCGGDTTSNASATVFPSGTPTTVGTGTGPSGQVVLVRLGTDNLVESDPPLYRKTWVAIVTDTAGNPVSGATVIFSMRSGTPLNPGRYVKGFYVLPPPAPAPQVWNQFVTVICPNEDTNFNSILDPGEDVNGNGLLEPPGVVDVTISGSDVSDASGIVRTTLTYPKNYGGWAELTLQAITSNAGATPASATFFLERLAADFSDLGVGPPGDPSPFGVSGSCNDTL